MEGWESLDAACQAPWIFDLRSSMCEVLVLDARQARAAGQLCGVATTTDVIDASVAVAAGDRGARVLTSDPDDIRRLDHRLDVVPI